MARYKARPSVGYPEASVRKEPLLTRSLATALAIGAPVGIVVWLAVQQMPDVTWVISQLFLRAGQ